MIQEKFQTNHGLKTFHDLASNYFPRLISFPISPFLPFPFSPIFYKPKETLNNSTYVSWLPSQQFIIVTSMVTKANIWCLEVQTC